MSVRGQGYAKFYVWIITITVLFFFVNDGLCDWMIYKYIEDSNAGMISSQTTARAVERYFRSINDLDYNDNYILLTCDNINESG